MNTNSDDTVKAELNSWSKDELKAIANSVMSVVIEHTKERIKEAYRNTNGDPERIAIATTAIVKDIFNTSKREDHIHVMAQINALLYVGVSERLVMTILDTLGMCPTQNPSYKGTYEIKP